MRDFLNETIDPKQQRTIGNDNTHQKFKANSINISICTLRVLTYIASKVDVVPFRWCLYYYSPSCAGEEYYRIIKHTR